MRITVQHIGGSKFTISNATESLDVEIPMLDGDAKAGLQPAEMLLGSLGACMMSSGMEFVKRNGGDINGVTMTVDAEGATRPVRLSEISVHTNFSGDEDDKTRGQFTRAAGRCKIHNTLSKGPEISVEP